MKDYTLIYPNTKQPLVQTGEPYHCWECVEVDQGGSFLTITHSPLEAYANHIYYMRLSCKHNNRCIRLGDAIAPLPPLDKSINENLALVQGGLAFLAGSVPINKQHQDPVAKIVYMLVAGRISPETAIIQLHSMVTLGRLYRQPDYPIHRPT